MWFMLSNLSSERLDLAEKKSKSGDEIKTEGSAKLKLKF